MLQIDLLGHTDAGDKTAWPGDQSERPLSALGIRQAAVLADTLLAESRFDALYSSPALRCRQTLDPLARRFGLKINVLSELDEADGYALPPGWETSRAAPISALGASYAAGRMLRALRLVQGEVGEGRVAICSHGDVIPALLALLRGSEGMQFPPPHEVRGGWYMLAFDGKVIRVVQQPLLGGFPHS